jgi:hypothetical protein
MAKLRCKREQKIAYNFLFTDAHINKMSLEKILYCIDKFHTEKLKKFNIDLIKQCIIKNYENYIKKPFIASSYEEIAEKLPL